MLEEKWGLNIHPCSAPMITRRRRTRSSGEDSDQTRVEFSSENDFNLAAVDMTTCRDRTSEFISAVKSLQSRQVIIKLEISLFSWTGIVKLAKNLFVHYLLIQYHQTTGVLTGWPILYFVDILSFGCRSAVLLITTPVHMYESTEFFSNLWLSLN